jgi:hypothetical protein
MDTFGDVLKAAMLKAGADLFFEELEELLEGSLLGVIFENFTVKVIQDIILERLEDAHDELDIENAFSECASRARGVDLDAVFRYGGEVIYETYQDLEAQGLLGAHPNWQATFDDNEIYIRDYLDLEESEHTNLKSEISDIAAYLIDNRDNKREVLAVFFDTKDPQEVKSQFAEMVAESLREVEAFSEICDELGEYEFGFLTDCDDFEDSEYPLDVVRRMLRAAPEQFELNTYSTCSSANGVRLYISEFFEGKAVPEHLIPWAYLQDTEADPVQWLKACKEVGARTAVPSTTYTQMLEMYERDLLGFDAIVYAPRVKSSPSIRVPDNCALIIHTRGFLENLNQYEFLENFMSPEQGLESTIYHDHLFDVALEGIHGRVDTILWFVGQGTRSNLALPAGAEVREVSVNSGFSEIVDYLEPSFGFGDDTSIYARIPNHTSLEKSYLRGATCARSLYVDDLVMRLGKLHLNRELLDFIDAEYPAVNLYEPSPKYVCLETIADDVTVVATVEDSFYEVPCSKQLVFKKGGNVITALRANPAVSSGRVYNSGSIQTPKEVPRFEDFARYDVVIYTDVGENTPGLQSQDALHYIGWQSPKKLYKNSNFMAYSYLYMFLYQILGRFGEHAQSDTASQTLPLGAMFEVYFEKDPPQNPRQFLERAKDLLLESRHPLIPPTALYATQNGFFTSPYIGTLSSKDFDPYNSPLRFLYSFIDTYTKPLAILYNAIQFGSGPRPNPELRSEKSNITCSYPLNYSDGSWVREYLHSVFESQGAEFSQASHLREGVNPPTDQVLQELARFTEHAQVGEYYEILALSNALDMLTKGTAGAEIEYPAAMGKRASGLVEILAPLMNTGNMKSRSDFKQKEVFDLEGGFDMSPFSQQLVAAITFFSEFTSLAMGPFIVGLEDSRFYSLFMRGDSSPQAPVKNSADFRDLLKFPVVTSGIRKIVKNKDVASVIGEERTRLPFTRANLSKNLVPLDLIRYLISDAFPDTYTFTPMGMDARAKIPSTERLSLGAYVSIFTALIHANKTFLNLQSAGQYGAAQAVLSTYSVDFDDLRSESGEVDLSDFTYIVRQATADLDIYDDEGTLSPASEDTIRERFRNLSAAYSICIGQIQSYAEDAAKEELEVFTFFDHDTNVSTLGFYLKGEHNGTYEYSIVDSNGQNNDSCSSFGSEAAQFIVNWLADTVLAYTISEDDLTAILKGEQDELPTAEIDFVLNDGNVRDLFRICAAYTDSPAGFCTRLSPIFKKFSVDQIEAATPILAEIDFFRYLLASEPEVSANVRQSLYSNKLSAYSKPLFRAVK